MSRLQHTDCNGRYPHVLHRDGRRQQAWHRIQHAQRQGSTVVFHSHPSSGPGASGRYADPAQTESEEVHTEAYHAIRQALRALTAVKTCDTFGVADATPIYFPNRT